MEQLKTLVRSAIGFNTQRGDAVEVVNLRFAGVDENFGVEQTVLLGLTKADLFRIIETLVLAIVAVLVILLVVRPLVARAFDAAKEATSAGLLTDQSMGALGALPGYAGAGMGGAIMGPNGVPLLPGQAGYPENQGYGDGTGTALATTTDPEETMIDMNQIDGRVRASSVKKIAEIVDKHPEEAVAILRSWMYQGA
jgi:flagellar M-ring protein FliF